MSIANSRLWYSDEGAYMTEINSYLRERPESGLTDENGEHDVDDAWERMWDTIPCDRINEVRCEVLR